MPTVRSNGFTNSRVCRPGSGKTSSKQNWGQPGAFKLGQIAWPTLPISQRHRRLEKPGPKLFEPRTFYPASLSPQGLGQAPRGEIVPTINDAIIAIDILLEPDARMLQHAK